MILRALTLLFSLVACYQAIPQLANGQEPARKEENVQRDAEETQRLTELFLRNQSVFIRKGELMVELNTFYNRNSRTSIEPLLGGVLISQNTRRFIDNTIIARYGLLTDGLEVDLIVPAFIHAEQQSDIGVLRTGVEQDGVGDISAAVRYQVWYERGARPALVVDIDGKSHTGGSGLTGTGTWNAGGGITLLKSIDPVVFFGRLGYTYNFASHSRDLGNIYEARLGMGFSLNDKVSFNIQFSYANVEPSQVSGTLIGGVANPALGPLFVTTRRAEIMNLLFTTTIVVTKKFSIEPIFGVPLTDQSFTIVGIRIPYRF